MGEKTTDSQPFVITVIMPHNLPKETVSELACTYASLLLFDENLPIDATKIKSLITAANIEVEPFWPSVFARYLQGKDIGALLANIGGSAASPAAAATGGASADSGSSGAAVEDKKAESESEEPSDDDAFGGLF